MEEANRAGVFDASPTELARILGLFAGKGGAGNPPFEKIDLRVSPGPNGRVILSTDHTNSAKNLGIRAAWSGATGDGATFEVATNEPLHLIDHLSGGFFLSEKPVRFRYGGDGPESGRIHLSQGSRSASVPTSPIAGVPRQPIADTFVTGPDGVFVSSDPTKPRPGPGAPWAEWTAAGYIVASFPARELGAILTAAGNLSRHGSRGVLIRFRIDASGIEVVCSDPKDPTAEVARIERLEGAEVVAGSPEDTFSIQYAHVEPIWSALSSTKAERIGIVRLPSGRRVNLIAVERDDTGFPTLVASLTFAIYSDPRTRKVAPPAPAPAGTTTGADAAPAAPPPTI